MHSRIFGLTLANKKRELYEHNEEQVYETMQGYADYVIKQEKNTTEFFESWQWLAKSSSVIVDARKKDESYFVSFGIKELHDYFKQDFENFKQKVNDLSFDDFCKPYGMKTYELEQSLYPTSGFWVVEPADPYVDTTTYKTWLKYVYNFMVQNSIDILEYELVEVFDYHN